MSKNINICDYTICMACPFTSECDHGFFQTKDTKEHWLLALNNKIDNIRFVIAKLQEDTE